MAASAASVSEFLPASERFRDFRRILMTVDNDGEGWRYALTLGAALAAGGHEIVLATFGSVPSRQQRREAAAIAGVALRSCGHRLAAPEHCWNDLHAAGKWLLDLAAETQPDVVHLNHFGHAALPWQCPVVVSAHSCAHVWWQAVHHMPPPSSWRGHGDAVAADLKAADAVVVPTQAMLRSLRQHYGVLGATRVIADGCAAVDHPVQVKDHYILSAGALQDPARNMDALAVAAKRLSWSVCIADQGQAAAAVPDRFTGLRLLGPLNGAQLQRWIAHASIYAQPSRCEPYGLGIMEAAAAGCALVLGDVACLRELWDGAALFVDPDDADELAHALTGLIDDPLRRANFGVRARLRARRYTSAAMAEGYAALYAELSWRHPQRAAYAQLM
jgi:glycosyltransferase involved in cell wall biosynthesis